MVDGVKGQGRQSRPRHRTRGPHPGRRSTSGSRGSRRLPQPGAGRKGAGSEPEQPKSRKIKDSITNMLTNPSHRGAKDSSTDRNGFPSLLWSSADACCSPRLGPHLRIRPIFLAVHAIKTPSPAQRSTIWSISHPVIERSVLTLMSPLAYRAQRSASVGRAGASLRACSISASAEAISERWAGGSLLLKFEAALAGQN